MSGESDSSASRVRDIIWQPEDEPGIEHLRLDGQPNGVEADGEIVRLLDGVPLRLRYRIGADRRWVTRSLRIESSTLEGDGLWLESDGEGRWRDHSGELIAALDGCIDVDIAVTPFTNSLPVRRLGLHPGRSAEIGVVYVSVPDLTVAPAAQRYSCLDESETGAVYRYEGLGTDFTVELAFDRDGLVLDYPGLWRRAWSTSAVGEVRE